MADATEELASALGPLVARVDSHLVFRPERKEDVVRGARLAHRLGVRLERAPRSGAVHLDFSRLNHVVGVDATSTLVHAQVGASLGAIEAALASQGCSLMTAASPELTLGDYLASGCSGARETADDPVGQCVAGIEAVALDGRLLDIRPAPRRAVGPDWVGAILASGWALAIPISAHLVARPARTLHALGFHFGSEHEAESALAWMRGRGARPALTRLREDGSGARLSIWLEGGSLLSPTQLIVTEEAKRRGATVTEPDDYAANPRSPRPSSGALAPLEALLRGEA